jgi:hypothetical protein
VLSKNVIFKQYNVSFAPAAIVLMPENEKLLGGFDQPVSLSLQNNSPTSRPKRNNPNDVAICDWVSPHPVLITQGLRTRVSGVRVYTKSKAFDANVS